MQIDHYFVALFAPDGERVGLDATAFASLSAKWIGFCSAFLDANPPWFERSLGGPLSQIKVAGRWVDGSARLLFSVDDVPCVSSALLTNNAPVAEAGFLRQFRTDIAQAAAPFIDLQRASPFGDMELLSERPLALVVVWPSPGISDGDQELVRELQTHFAAAYFLGIGRPGADCTGRHSGDAHC
jgi:hypothetical protein